MKAFRKTHVIAVAGVVSTLFFLGLYLKSPRFIEERIESVSYDLRFQVGHIFRPPVVPDDIVIVEIDERSLEQYGRWPWDRAVQARLVDRILSAGPRVLAVDIFYPEPQNEKADGSLARALRSAPGRVVLAAGFDRDDSALDADTPDHLMDNAVTNVRDLARFRSGTRFRSKLSIPALSSSAALGNVFNPPDLDGKLRWEHLYIRYKTAVSEDFIPSLSLMTAARALGKGPGDITVYAGRGVALGDIYMPTDETGRMRINYLGPERTLRYVSAADVLGGRHDPALKDRIVFLGTSALQTYDFTVSPVSARMPGVEKNATVTGNILRRQFTTDAPLSVVALAILVTGLALARLLPRLRALPGVVLSLAFIVCFAAVNQYFFTWQNVYINFVYPFSNLVVISVFSGTYKYLTEELKARELKRMFSSYVSPKIVEQLIQNPEMAKLGGHRREITVLFSDVRGFTTFSEQREPEEVVSMLNEYLTEMTEIVFKWDGTLDKFVGDEIMAFWGAPLEQPDHAERAFRCALHMSDRLEQLQKKWVAEGKAALDCGIGINTGPVVIGNIGAAGKKMDYTAIGDHVNLGARVEALTRNYTTRILITEFTHGKIHELAAAGKFGHVVLTERDVVKVKGKERPVKVYEVRCLPCEPGAPPG